MDYENFLAEFGSEKFQKLWNSQKYVLEKYNNGFEAKPDVAIELPTGSGKTLIALLIGEKKRREGAKVAILSANKTLARQMTQEAESLGIPVVLMEGSGVDIPSKDKRNYHRGKKIAVMNYWVYFNQNPVLDNADLLIMDDAHLAEHCLHSLYSVEISVIEHENLFRSLVKELLDRYPEYSILSDALDDNIFPDTPPELLSFIDQVEISDRIKEIIDSSPELDSDKNLMFRWKRIRGKINEANIYIGLNFIWIRPYVYPLIGNEHYSSAKQRIYFSATIGAPSDLSRRLGTARIEKIEIDRQFSERTSGRRLIVMNRIDDKDFPERLQEVVLNSLTQNPKSVWICTSKSEAEKFKTILREWLNANKLVGHEIWVLSSLGNEIDDFKKAKQGHLIVASRFDGMDFKGDECRLVVLVTIPRAINDQEKFLCAHIGDPGFMKRRLNQRIIQALGRCNREQDDYAVYVLADRRFATHFGREANRTLLPNNLIVEIDMAEDMADIKQLELNDRVTKFLAKDFTAYDEEYEELLRDINESSNSNFEIEKFAELEVVGWSALFQSQNYTVAAQKFEECYKILKGENLIELSAFYAYYWAKALYLDAKLTHNQFTQSLEVLEEAINRGGMSSWFNRLRASLNRISKKEADNVSLDNLEYFFKLKQAFDDILERVGTRGNNFEKMCNKLDTQLNSLKHNEYQEGLRALGKLLGYETSSPKGSSATDCRWKGTFGNTKVVYTFELKIEHEPSNKIVAKYVGQAHNQLNTAMGQYDKLGYIVRSFILTHLTEIADDAESAIGKVRILNKSDILELWNKIKTTLANYRSEWSIDNISSRELALSKIKPIIPKSEWLIDVSNSDNIFININQLLKEWK